MFIFDVDIIYTVFLYLRVMLVLQEKKGSKA